MSRAWIAGFLNDVGREAGEAVMAALGRGATEAEARAAARRLATENAAKAAKQRTFEAEQRRIMALAQGRERQQAAQAQHNLAVANAQAAKDAAAARPRSQKLKAAAADSKKAEASAKTNVQQNTPRSRFAEPVARGAAPARPLAHTRVPLPEVAPELPPSVTGSFDATANVPVTYKGQQIFDLSPGQMAEFGEELGVPNLGPLSEPKTIKYRDTNEPIEIPGGIEDGTWTYEDLMSMKGGGINANRLDPEDHLAMQRKMMNTLRGDPNTLSDAQVLSGLTFGYTSPNNPLSPNQLATSRLRMSSLEDLDRLVNNRDWALEDPASFNQRTDLSNQIAERYGLNAGKQGGLGVRGSVDYSGYADLLDMFGRYPEYFHRGEGEDWGSLVERMSNQVPGLGNKTGSFGVAWQPDAGVSAIDRHMVGRYIDTILADPAKREAFEARAMRRGNANRIEDVPHGLIQEMLLDEVGKNPSVGLRTSKGLINPNVPPHLAGGYVAEPRENTLKLLGPTYRSVIDANEEAMAGSGLHLFGNQWNVWDKIRQRFEPHENMFPGLENIPRLNVPQMNVVNKQHTASGHKTYGKEKDASGEVLQLKPTRKVDYTRMRYFADGGPVRRGSLAVDPDIARRR